VTVSNVTVTISGLSGTETTYILLGVKFLAQVDGVLRIHPHVLEMTNSQL
jgi:hypothetical protein